jgi:hypothetical protein
LYLQGWQIGCITEIGKAFTFRGLDDAARQHFSVAKFIRRFRQPDPNMTDQENEMLQSQLPESIITGTAVDDPLLPPLTSWLTFPHQQRFILQKRRSNLSSIVAILM